MDRRKFLQTLAVLGSSTALPSHARGNSIPPAEVLPLPAVPAKAGRALQNSKPDEHVPRIGIVTIGGAGGAICNCLAAGLPYLDRSIAIDTNPFALHQITADHKILMGKGKRTLYEPSIARSVVRQVSDDVANSVSGLDLVLILSGMGGVTGTTISPIVAETLHKMNIPALGIVITPFNFEGRRRMRVAQNGLGALDQYATAVLPISNEVLSCRMGESVPLASVLDKTQLTFNKLYRNIANAACGNSLVGIDFVDVMVVLNEGRRSAFGYGSASGNNHVAHATRNAILSPLLGENHLRLASGILVAVEGKRDSVKRRQLESVMNMIQQHVSPKAHVLLSATVADLDDDFSVSILATGFPSTLV